MGFWENFPYTNFHSMNLDWILKEVKKIPDYVRIEVSKLEILNLVENIVVYGAENEKDSTSAVRAAVVAAKTSGKPVYVPKGNYPVNKEDAFPYSARFIGPGSLEWGGVKYNLWGYNFITEHGGSYEINVVENNVEEPAFYDQNLHGNISKSVVYDGGRNGTKDDSDRTAYMAVNLNMQSRGDGDAGCANLSGYMTKAGSPDAHFIPALILANGQAITFAKDTYLNPFEFNLHDNGHPDVRAVGFVLNMFKDGESENPDRYWSGFRIQNKGGKSLPVAYQAVGGKQPISVAFDASRSGGECGLAMRSGQRIFFGYSPEGNVPSAFTVNANMGVVDDSYFIIAIGDAQLVIDKNGRLDCPPNVTLTTLYPAGENPTIGTENQHFNAVYSNFFVDGKGSLRFEIETNRGLIDSNISKIANLEQRVATLEQKAGA